MEISYRGTSYFTQRLGHETDELLAKRLWFIIRLNPKNDLEYAEAERLSRIWFNMRYFGCHYSIELEDQIFDLIDPNS